MDASMRSLMQQRKSVRTFDGRPLSAEDRRFLEEDLAYFHTGGSHP